MFPLKNTQTWKEIREILSDTSRFSNLDIHFAEFIARLSGINSPYVPLAAALTSCYTGEGNVCFDLKEYSKINLPAGSSEETKKIITCPPFTEWTELLLKSGIASQEEGNTPLVLDHDGRLYLRRYWEYEKSIAYFIKERATASAPDIDPAMLAKDIRKTFASPSHVKTDWQKIAAMMAVTRLFTVVSGGPGTGKTSTVAKMIALLHAQHAHKKRLRLLLGAPTGKAASRLQDAITATELLPGAIDLPPASTLHRMLGTIPHSPYFRHNTDNPLDADIVIIDEASMVDLPLMAKLMQAVPPSARLILLGDRHQLASVQPGSVLGDICPRENLNRFSAEFCRQILETAGEALTSAETCLQESESDLQDSFIELVDNFRFPAESGIAKLSQAVKEGNGHAAVDLLLSDKTGQISWKDIPASAELADKLQGWSGFSDYVSMQHAKDPHGCFAVLDRHRVLCGLRRGPYGMQRINSILEHQLAGRYGFHGTDFIQQQKNPDTFAEGQPVMVTRNDHSLDLYNGDIGIIMTDPERKDAKRVYFRKESGILRNIGLALLPAHETVFAMTVHKSQGSEFDRVLLILPDKDSPLLTRELLYTAITRARENIEIWGRKDLLRLAVERRITRTSGLRQALWG